MTKLFIAHSNQTVHSYWDPLESIQVQNNVASLRGYITCSVIYFHSLPEFNLPFTDALTWLTPPGPYRVTACRERELTLDHVHTFLTTQGHGGPVRKKDHLNAGATSETTRTWNTIHTIHTLIHANNVNMKGWLRRLNDIRGSCGPKGSWLLSYRWRKPRKNLIQETCPDRRSKLGPLHDSRACYRLFHRGGNTQYKLN